VDLNGGEEIGGTEVIEGLRDDFLIVRKSCREGRRDRRFVRAGHEKKCSTDRSTW